MQRQITRRTRIAGGRASVATVTALAMALTPTASLFAAPAQAPTVTVTPNPATTGGATDRGWPRAYSTPSGARLLVYQPQVSSWSGQRRLVAYAAVAYEMKGAAKPALGSLKLEADSKVALSERLVNFSTLTVTESNFPTLDKEKVRELVAEIVKAIPEEDRVISLDRVLAHIDKSDIIPKNEEGVKSDPPRIFFSPGPARLVNIDGEPIWSPIKENDLKFAVNTNWDLFQHEPTRTFYLRDDKTWLKATDLSGAWTPAGALPQSFSRLPADANWTEVKAALPGQKLSVEKTPKVFVSTTPAEMILTTGTPVYQPVAGTRLGWVSNTESDVFRLGGNGPVYYLVSGRWFSAPDFKGPWTFATLSLPAEFQKISLEHPRSRVLASVPGTQQAAEAVLLAQVPQTARVNKKEIKAPEVAYQGEPRFEPIETTTVSQAVNTDKDIIKVGDLYYMCFQGVWFMASSPSGPWEAASSVPKAIYEIPVSSPAHNVTYVTVVEDNDDDEWVTYATVAAYTGVMIAWGCAVWGSGWYYPPYYGWGGGYPYYYPRYPSYGYGAAYNPWTGAYGRYGAAYGPYGGAGVASRYNPRTGTYSRGAAAWGPYGARGYGEAYNPRTGAYGQTRQGSNVYGSWGSTSVQRGDQWANTRRVTNNVTGNTTRVTRTDSGAGAITSRGPGADAGAIRTTNGDVYAGRDGNVYRRQDSGSWEKYDNGNWGSTNRPTQQQRDTSTTGTRSTPSTMDQLDRDSRARSEGTQRTRDYSTYQRSGGSRSGAGSYRGGGARGGGGRRR
ncbi:MAG TPA: hypothetical protein PLD86_00660 [Vicinamibacteria bacterium]|nr:hypothetical protein [Vicinamibacteria bacterium]